MAGVNQDVSQPFAVLPSQTADDGRSVLLVEDDAGDALIVQELLADAWPGLDVRRVASIAEAEVALTDRVDCVILDLGLPDARGIDALTRIQTGAPETAVVVLTGDTEKGRGIEALTAGAQDYLVKGEITGEGLARAIGYSIQRKLSERTARELAVLRVTTAENARVYRGLVPRPLVDHDLISVRSSYTPGNERQVLGGDFFDVVSTSENCVHAVLGDVCGRGPDEAALGVQLRIAWRTLTLADVAQQTVLRSLDQLTKTERHAEHIFATMATVMIDLVTGMATVAVAGHPPPIVIADRDASLLVDHAGGPPLGLAEGAPWEIAEVNLGLRWTLLLYSDGIYEGHSGAAGQRLGIDGFVQLLADKARQDTLWSELPGPLIASIEALNDGPLDDDVALLALRFDGERE